MAGGGFEHVSPGERWQPSAIEINAMKDAARAHQGGSGVSAPGVIPQGLTIAPLLVRVRNATGADQSRYCVFSLGSPRWSMDSDFAIASGIFDCVAYDEDLPTVVIQQPLLAGEIGVGCIAGPTLARIAGTGLASDRDATPNSSGVLQPGSGSISYFYDRPTGGGVVLLNLGAGGKQRRSGLAILQSSVAAASPVSSTGLLVGLTAPTVNATALDAGAGINEFGSTAITIVLHNCNFVPIPTNSLVQYKQCERTDRLLIDTWNCAIGLSGPGPDPEPDPEPEI